MFPPRVLGSLALLACLSLAGCAGGGGGGASGGSGARKGGAASADFNCDGECANQNLSSDEVRLILRQGVAEAQRLGVAATFAVTDRVGNVLAIYQMPGANPLTRIDGQIGAQGGLEQASVPSVLAAISKAGTGAYLSSQGNAFTTRTASQIVQENFNPQERNAPGGPLFGVQFSQLICSDVNTTRFGGRIGPRPMPLGLSADPGGIPLYQGGDMIGGLGVEFDGVYRADPIITDVDDDPEERIALVASLGFEAPSQRTADVMFVGGKALRYTDLEYGDLTVPASLPELEASGLVAAALFNPGEIQDGVVFGTAPSGYINTTRAGVPSMILVDERGNPRFPTRGGTPLPGGIELTPTEVEAILDSAITTAFRARAAIRRPLDTAARVSIWVIDTTGTPLGFTRNADAPVFGTDVSLQKARAALLFSSPDAADLLNRLRSRRLAAGVAFEDYVGAFQALLGSGALNGQFAFSNRAVGNVARPFFPDGINGNPNGPLSLPFPPAAGRSWSPFNDGLQLDLILPALLAPLSGTIPDSCVDSDIFGRRLNNGIQIFPGSVPLYRNGTLIGAIGISGDGIDQDDMIAFFSSSRAGLDHVGHFGIGDPVSGFNAPQQIRADKIALTEENSRLRYVSCPEGPFRGDNDQNVCQGS